MTYEQLFVKQKKNNKAAGPKNIRMGLLQFEEDNILSQGLSTSVSIILDFPNLLDLTLSILVFFMCSFSLVSFPRGDQWCMYIFAIFPPHVRIISRSAFQKQKFKYSSRRAFATSSIRLLLKFFKIAELLLLEYWTKIYQSAIFQQILITATCTSLGRETFATPSTEFQFNCFKI